MDGLARDEAGRVWIVEHKTTIQDIGPGSEYWTQLRLDGQVSFYYLAAKQLGYDVAGCLYDVALRPRLRPAAATPMDKRRYKKDGTLYSNQRAEDEAPEEYRHRLREDIAENADKYFRRGTVVRTDAELAEFQAELWQVAKRIREAQRSGLHDRNDSACIQYGRPCPFFDTCIGAAELSDQRRFRTIRRHPELSLETTKAAA